MQLFSGLVGKPDCAHCSFASGFDQSSDDRQHFRQRRSRKNQLQDVEYSLAGEEGRFVLVLFNARQSLHSIRRCSLHETPLPRRQSVRGGDPLPGARYSLLACRRPNNSPRSGVRATSSFLCTLAEGERKGLNARIKKFDCKGSVFDLTLLPDELVKTRIPDLAGAIRSGIKSSIVAGRDAV